MRQRARLFYVAVEDIDGEIAGLGGLDLNEIRLLYVAPEFQRRGVGSELLRHLEAMVPPGFFTDIFLYAAPDAVDFYHARGYQPRGEYQFDIEAVAVPTVFMTKYSGP